MKITIINKEDIDKMKYLMDRKINDAYFTMYESNGFKTICQYSSKYDNLHIVSVNSSSLAGSNKACLD